MQLGDFPTFEIMDTCDRLVYVLDFYVQEATFFLALFMISLY